MSNNTSSTPCFLNFIVIALLPTLFVAGIVMGYLHIIPLKVDLHSVIIIGFIYLIYLLFIQHNANYVICNMRKNHHDLQEKIQQSIQENSLSIGDKTKSTIDIRKEISHYYSMFRNDNFASIAPSFFPMLGILGTFTAIALSMPDFNSTNSEALDSEISLLLSGIGTAFYASIYGIFLSILWNYFEKRGLSKADQDAYRLEHTYSKFIWTESELKRHEHMQHIMRDERLIQGLKETFNLEFIQRLNETHLENFQKIIDETNKNFTTVTNHMKMVSTDLKDTIAKIHHSQDAIDASANLQRNIQQFNNLTQNLQHSIDKFDHSLENALNLTFHKIDDELGDVIIKLGNFASSISEQNRLLTDSISQYHHEIANKLNK